MTVLHTGSTKKYAAGWELVFGNKRSGERSAAPAKSGKQAPKAAKAKSKNAKKKSATAKKRK